MSHLRSPAPSPSMSVPTEYIRRLKTSLCIPVNFQALSQGLSLVSHSGSSKLKSWSHTKPSWLLCSDSHVLHQSLPDVCFMFLIPFRSAWTPGGHRGMAAIPSSGTGQDQSLPCCDKQGSGIKGHARVFANSTLPAGCPLGAACSQHQAAAILPLYEQHEPHPLIPAERSPAGSRAACPATMRSGTPCRQG